MLTLLISILVATSVSPAHAESHCAALRETLTSVKIDFQKNFEFLPRREGGGYEIFLIDGKLYQAIYGRLQLVSSDGKVIGLGDFSPDIVEKYADLTSGKTIAAQDFYSNTKDLFEATVALTNNSLVQYQNYLIPHCRIYIDLAVSNLISAGSQTQTSCVERHKSWNSFQISGNLWAPNMTTIVCGMPHGSNLSDAQQLKKIFGDILKLDGIETYLQK